jgi:hypothetical protein
MAAANRRLASVARHMVQVDPEPAAATESSAGIAAFRLDGRTAFITGGARCASCHVSVWPSSPCPASCSLALI